MNIYVKPDGREIIVNDSVKTVPEHLKKLGWKKKPGPKPNKAQQLDKQNQ